MCRCTPSRCGPCPVAPVLRPMGEGTRPEPKPPFFNFTPMAKCTCLGAAAGAQGGSHPTDVRMTTRFKPDNVLEGLTGAIHETGACMQPSVTQPAPLNRLLPHMQGTRCMSRAATWSTTGCRCAASKGRHLPYFTYILVLYYLRLI